MAVILIGIDDTDFGDSPGTGQLARRVAEEILRVGGRGTGITRHQFLVDPRIPYTAHNRGICVGMEWEGAVSDLEFVFDLVRGWSVEGSDPGVCIAEASRVGREVAAWGEMAMSEVLTMEGARGLAAKEGLDLRELGGTGQGIIGALGSVGLRVGGKHGRFVDMPGLRGLGEEVTAERLAEMGIEIEHREGVLVGSVVGSKPKVYRTLGWVRPKLSNGRAVLSVEWSDDHDAWVPVDRKKVHAAE